MMRHLIGLALAAIGVGAVRVAEADSRQLNLPAPPTAHDPTLRQKQHGGGKRRPWRHAVRGAADRKARPKGRPDRRTYRAKAQARARRSRRRAGGLA